MCVSYVARLPDDSRVMLFVLLTSERVIAEFGVVKDLSKEEKKVFYYAIRENSKELEMEMVKNG